MSQNKSTTLAGNTRLCPTKPMPTPMPKLAIACDGHALGVVHLVTRPAARTPGDHAQVLCAGCRYFSYICNLHGMTSWLYYTSKPQFAARRSPPAHVHTWPPSCPCPCRVGFPARLPARIILLYHGSRPVARRPWPSLASVCCVVYVFFGRFEPEFD